MGGKIDGYKADMIASLESNDYESYETMVEALHEEGIEDSEIKTKIGTAYRDQYKEAYRTYLKTGSQAALARMLEIEDILDMTDFEFNYGGKGGWQEQVEDKLAGIQ